MNLLDLRGPEFLLVYLVLMAAAIVVATAAGIVGVIMLVAPTSTGTYFAWALAPPGLAALVGGFGLLQGSLSPYPGPIGRLQGGSFRLRPPSGL